MRLTSGVLKFLLILFIGSSFGCRDQIFNLPLTPQLNFLSSTAPIPPPLGTLSNTHLVGGVGYSLISNAVILTASQVQNFGNTSTHPLRLELWLSIDPFNGTTNATKAAELDLGSLTPFGTLINIDSGPLPWKAPSPGTYFVTMVLTEYTAGSADSGYAVLDYMAFTQKLTQN